MKQLLIKVFFMLIALLIQGQNRYYDYHDRKPDNKPHILYLSGGSWHDNLEMAAILRHFLEKRHEYYITYTEEYSVLEGSLDVYDIILINGMPTKIKETHLKNLQVAVKEGKPLLGIHSATAALHNDTPKNIKTYVDILGAKFSKHPAIHTFPVKVVNQTHDITKNISNFSIYDEMYFYNEIREGSEVLIKASYEGEETPIAWTRSYGKGKVFYTSLGHSVGATTNRHFQQLILNALEWLLKN